MEDNKQYWCNLW